jgi:hypothetical protein
VPASLAGCSARQLSLIKYLGQAGHAGNPGSNCEGDGNIFISRSLDLAGLAIGRPNRDSINEGNGQWISSLSSIQLRRLCTAGAPQTPNPGSSGTGGEAENESANPFSDDDLTLLLPYLVKPVSPEVIGGLSGGGNTGSNGAQGTEGMATAGITNWGGGSAVMVAQAETAAPAARRRCLWTTTMSARLVAPRPASSR